MTQVLYWLVQWNGSWQSARTPAADLLAGLAGGTRQDFLAPPLLRLLAWGKASPVAASAVVPNDPFALLRTLCEEAGEEGGAPAGSANGTDRTLLQEVLERSLAISAASGDDGPVREAICNLAARPV